MRLFLLILITGWLLGVAVGVLGMGSRWLMVGVLAVVGLGIWSRQSWPVGVAVVMLVCLGFVYGVSAGQEKVASCVYQDTWQGVVTGLVEKQEKRIRFMVEMGDCIVLVSASPWLEVRRGDKVEVAGGRRQSLDEVADFSTGYATYLKRRGIGATWLLPGVTVKNNSSDVINGGLVFRVGRQVQKLRSSLQGRVQLLFVEPDASLVMGMLLARKGTIPEYVTENFRKTGVSHILAISGLHVSIIAGIIYVLVSWLPWRPWFRAGMIILMLWLYVWFIGSPMSAVRAASFVSIALVFLRLSKLVSLPTALVLTVATLVTVRPLVLFDVGFQLSVSAVTGIFLILFLAKRFDWRLTKRKTVLIWLYRLLLVSLGATLATTPLVAYHFGNVSLVGVVANLLVVPVVAPLLLLAIMAVLVSYVWPLGGLMVAWIAHELIRWLVFVTGKLASWPGVFVTNINLPLWAVLVYYLIMGGVVVFVVYRQGRNWREIWG